MTYCISEHTVQHLLTARGSKLKEQWKNKDFIWERDIPHPDAVAVVVEDWDTHDNFVVWFAGASAPIDFNEDNAWVDDLLEKVQ